MREKSDGIYMHAEHFFVHFYWFVAIVHLSIPIYHLFINFFSGFISSKNEEKKKLIAVTWLNLWWSCIFRAHIFHRTVHSWWICYAILSKPLYHLKWFGNRIKSPFVTKCECECECVRRARRQQTTDNTVPYIRDDTFDMVNKLDSIMWVYWI